MAATAVVALPLALASVALADSRVVTSNPGGLTAVGPVNADYGFPAWYQDKNKQRVELCLDGNDPMCGYVGAPVAGFDNTQPTVFPTNFPDEQFYMLASSQLALPGGGKATLTLGLEASFLNQVQNGDQITFARQRIYVVNGPKSATLHFHQPYGDIDVDTDDTGRAHFTEDIAPSVGNFSTPLKGNLGPFLTWTGGPVTTPSGQYLGDPAQLHAVTGGPFTNKPDPIAGGTDGNTFSATWDGLAQPLSTNQFNLQGKISTNTGFDGASAVQGTDSSGNPVIDVFADSRADASELYVAADSGAGIKSTPMVASSTTGAKSFYARVAVSGTMPANVTLNNNGDAPLSTIKVAVTKPSSIAVTDATYDGTTLHVAASSSKPGAVLTVAGYDPTTATLANGVADIPTGAPPANVSVTDGTDTASAPVRITAGGVTPPGEAPVPPSANTDPVCTVLDPADPTGQAEIVVPCVDGAPAPDAAPTAKVAPVTTPAALGDSVPLDASSSTNATSYEWSYVSGPQVTFTNGTTAKPTVKLSPYDVTKYTSANLPKAAQGAPAVVQVVAVNGTQKSAPVQVSIPVKTDTVQITTTKYTAGKEYRIDGTSTIPGVAPGGVNPATTVAIYNTTTGALVGTTQVDTTGAWSYRPRAPFAATQIFARNLTVVTSRGGYTTGTVTGAPN